MSQPSSQQGVPGPGPNNVETKLKLGSFRKAPGTSPKAGRDPVQPNNRGNQGQS